jgi:acylphosphatase
MITTFGKFYYGHTVGTSNRYIDFKEGAGPDLVATIDVGEYSLTDFIDKVSVALNNAGADTYTVTVNRTTRIITITSTGSFTLLCNTGVNSGQSAFSLLGFDAVDTGSASTHSGDFATGSEWVPQYKPQDNVDFDNNQMHIDGTVKQSTDGTVEAVKFGTKKIMEANYKFITNTQQSSSSPILNDTSGVDNARAFLEYAVTKADLEFMADKDDPDTFTKCILESTSEDKDGLSFKLKEQYSQGLVGYYETGLLKFRKIEV